MLCLPGCTEGGGSSEQTKGKIDIAIGGYKNIGPSDGLLQAGAPITYVGLGYNVLDNSYITPDGFTLGRPIFDAEKVADRLKTADSPVNPSQTIIGKSVSEYSSQLKAKLKLSADYPMFSGSLESEYDTSKTNRKDTYFVKSMSGYIKHSEYIKITNDLHTILDPTFEQALNSKLSPETLFGDYGTHVLVEALMGARCTYNYTYTSESSEETSSIQTKVNAAYSYISGSASLQEKEKAKSFLSNSYFCSMLSGGPNIDAKTLPDLLKNFPTWVAGLKDATPTIYGISNRNSLIPIWELTTDAGRAQELEAYFIKRGGDIQKLLDNMSKIPDAPSTKTYIESIVITSDSDDAAAKDDDAYKKEGYTRINKDLNEEAGGEYIYLWYKTTTDEAKALRDIRFTYGDFGDIPSFYTKNLHDLNAGAGGDYIYMWTTKQSTIGKPITGIKILYGKNADMPSGYKAAGVNYYKKGKNTRENAAELNHNAGGYYIYLGYTYN